MARIRTIKPDFWSDERIVELSPMARLFFIGMWNFADDHGGIERSPRQLKMKIFPGDAVDVEPLVQELLGSGMVVEYEVEGVRFLHIRNFLRHQRINRPSTPRIPAFKEGVHRKLPDDSLRTHGGLHEDSLTEGKGSGREGKGKEGKGKEVDLEGKGREGTHDDGPSPLEGGGAASPSIKDEGNGNRTATASGKKGERPDFAIIANLVAHIHDEDVQCRVVKAYDAVSSGTMAVDDALELLDVAEMGVRIRAELSQMFRSVRMALQ